MERREAVRNMALLFGGAISASTLSVLFDSCSQPESKDGNKGLFSVEQEALITEISDTIIPDTDTPGAKAAGVGSFVAMMLRECYPDEAQKIFVDGLENVDKVAESKFKKSFVSIAPEQRVEVLKEIADKTIVSKNANKEEQTRQDAEKNNNQSNKKEITSRSKVDPKKKVYFFQLIRELTLLGYFTSEIGATKALAYLPIPGKYEACIDLKPGQKTWAL